MLLTIALIVAAMIAVAAFELSCFWRLGERDDRRTRTPRNSNCITLGTCRRSRSLGRSAGWIHKCHRDCDRNAQCDQDQQQVLDTSETSPPGLIR